MATIVETLETVLAFRVTGLSSSVSQVDRALGGIQGSARLVGGAALGMAAGLGAAVNAGARLEQVKIGFQTLFGGAQQAEAMLQKIRDFDQQSPFDFEGTVKGAQRLKAMGFAAGEIIPTMTAAGDAVSALGGGQDTFDRVLLALGQIKTKGHLSAEEMMQLEEAGIGAADILTKKLGLSRAQLANLGSQGIESGKALEALRQGFEESFGGAMQRQSQTLEGRLRTLKGSVFQLGAALGEPFLGPINSAVKGVTDLVNAVNSAPGPVKTAAGVVGGVLVASAIGAWGWLKALELQNTKLMNSMLRAADAAGTEALALQGLGTAAGTAAAGTGAAGAGAGAGAGAAPGGGGGLGRFLEVLAVAAAAEETGRAFKSAEGKAFGAPEGVDPVRFVANRNAARRGRPDLVTDPAMRKALGLDGGKPAAAQTPEQKMIELLQRQLDELKGIRKGQGQMASVSTSEVALYRQMAGRRAIQYSR